MEYDKEFGDFLRAKREERRINSYKMGDLMGISKGYYCDFENYREIPPEHHLEKIIKILCLSKEDEAALLYLAKKAKKKVPPDMADYIMKNQVVYAAFREAMDKAVPEDWVEFKEKLNNKE